MICSSISQRPSSWTSSQGKRVGPGGSPNGSWTVDERGDVTVRQGADVPHLQQGDPAFSPRGAPRCRDHRERETIEVGSLRSSAPNSRARVVHLALGAVQLVWALTRSPHAAADVRDSATE